MSDTLHLDDTTLGFIAGCLRFAADHCAARRPVVVVQAELARLGGAAVDLGMYLAAVVHARAMLAESVRDASEAAIALSYDSTALEQKLQATLRMSELVGARR